MLVRQNSSRDVICAMDMLVLFGMVLSCCNLCLTICMAGFTGTEVNKAFTSTFYPPWSCWMKWCVFLRWCGDWPTRVSVMCASSLAMP